MLILNWNILSGGGKRVPRIMKFILDLCPSVCVLTEYRLGYSGADIKAKMLESGYGYWVEPETQCSKNSAAVFSQEPLAPARLSVEIPESLRPYLVATEVRNLCLIGVFCATQDVGGQLIDYLVKLADQDRERSYVVLGDFFFGPRRSNPNYGKPLQKLEKAGWVNALDSFNPSDETWSCQTSRGKSRPDHCYLLGPISTKVHEMGYIPVGPDGSVSDHVPMIVGFHMHPCQGC